MIHRSTGEIISLECVRSHCILCVSIKTRLVVQVSGPTQT